MERRIESAAPADLIFAYTRSQAIADGEAWKLPATIDDPAYKNWSM